jgi:hypothetical protein
MDCRVKPLSPSVRYNPAVNKPDGLARTSGNKRDDAYMA